MAPGRRPPVIRNLSDNDEHNATHDKKITSSTTSQAKARPRVIPKTSRQQPQDRTDGIELSAQRRQEPEAARRRQRPVVYDSEDDDTGMQSRLCAEEV